MSDDFEAGRLKNFVENWKNLTSDCQILDMVQNCHIELENDKNIFDKSCNYQCRFNESESILIEKEIQKLIDIKAIIETKEEEGQFLSPIFLRLKKNGEYRMILNLKKFNEFVTYHHFKMDTFETTLKLVNKNSYMASVDLRHAYYSIPIALDHQKLLRFTWNNKVFQFTCLPFGLACAPRYFTKLMKPIYAKLRNLGYTNIGYIDDSLLFGDTVQECENNVQETVSLMSNLGFMIQKQKSQLTPVTKILFLGNIIDSENMIVTLPQDKKEIIAKECRNLYNKEKDSIRNVARIIGLIVSSFSAVEFGKLFYRELEKEKILALKQKNGNYDSCMSISRSMKRELYWWFSNVFEQKRIISHGIPIHTIETDASSVGWGAHFESEKTGGRWTDDEKLKHINFLEILAIFFALKSYKTKIKNKHVKIMTDNSTAVAYINNMGGSKSNDCNEISRQVWLWCINEGIWLTCSHIPGILNTEADKKSRVFNDRTEWKLKSSIFQQIVGKWGKPQVDLFASRLNFQIEKFCAWKPDPLASFIDALSLNWRYFDFAYIFPPFSLLSSCVQKIRMEGTKAILIAPLWPTQPWFSRLMELLIDRPVIIPKIKNLLKIPYKSTEHPLQERLVLIACLVSGNYTENEAFRQKQWKLSCHPGKLELKNNIRRSQKDGFNTVVKNRLIHFSLL